MTMCCLDKKLIGTIMAVIMFIYCICSLRLLLEPYLTI